MKFNEDSRVKIPGILPLCRLGYEYLSLKNTTADTLNFRNENTSIFRNIFIQSLQRINQGVKAETAERLRNELLLDLENEDLGQAFYEKITARSGVKYIYCTCFDNNTFHVITE